MSTMKSPQLDIFPVLAGVSSLLHFAFAVGMVSAVTEQGLEMSAGPVMCRELT